MPEGFVLYDDSVVGNIKPIMQVQTGEQDLADEILLSEPDWLYIMVDETNDIDSGAQYVDTSGTPTITFLADMTVAYDASISGDGSYHVIVAASLLPVADVYVNGSDTAEGTLTAGEQVRLRAYDPQTVGLKFVGTGYLPWEIEIEVT